ncbi:hypothetical protein D3C86_1966710 [compost metagenome]
MISGGVPVGTMMPCQAPASKPRKPDSASVGTSGNSDMRSAVVTASRFMCRLLIKGMTELMVSVRKSIWPLASARSAGALPLYGMCVASSWAACSIWNAARCVTLPLPAEP